MRHRPNLVERRVNSIVPYEHCKALPDVCIGTDPFHTPGGLAERLAGLFAAHSNTTMIDQPFSGSMAPMNRNRNDRRVVSVMIEVNRGLYIDEETGAPLTALPEIATAIREIVSWIIKEMGCRYTAGED